MPPPKPHSVDLAKAEHLYGTGSQQPPVPCEEDWREFLAILKQLLLWNLYSVPGTMLEVWYWLFTTSCEGDILIFM